MKQQGPALFVYKGAVLLYRRKEGFSALCEPRFPFSFSISTALVRKQLVYQRMSVRKCRPRVARKAPGEQERGVMQMASELLKSEKGVVMRQIRSRGAAAISSEFALVKK